MTAFIMRASEKQGWMLCSEHDAARAVAMGWEVQKLYDEKPLTALEVLHMLFDVCAVWAIAFPTDTKTREEIRDYIASLISVRNSA